MSGSDKPHTDIPKADDALRTEDTPQTDPQSSKLDGGLSRRHFFTAGGGAAAALALGGSPALAEHDDDASPPSLADTVSTLGTSAQETFYQPFCEPPTERSSYGTLNTTLRVMPASITIREPGNLRVEQTRTYNGIVPGPTYRVKAGDRMNIRLVNSLPPNSDANCPPPDPNMPHCFNTTNLHTHGLHVSPEPPSDDVFLHLEPGQQERVCIEIPAFHSSGTYWYHAHKHGSTAIQLVNGLAGALIVEDPPSITAARMNEKVMVIQEIIGEEAAEMLYGPNLDGRLPDHMLMGEDAPEDVYNCMGGSPCSKHEFTVNGCSQPTLNLRPGEIQRWRLINATATPRGYTKLQVNALTPVIAPPQIWVIAVDGIYLQQPKRFTEHLLVPGGRVDLAVRFPSPGKYELLRIPTQGGGCADQPLVNVAVEGAPIPLSPVFPPVLPELPEYLKPITDDEWKKHGKITRNLTFEIIGQGDPDVPCHERFLIDGQSFDPNRLDQEMELGTVEKWVITNSSNASHPFHIHVNPFQVISIDAEQIPIEDRIWQDTVNLPPGSTVSFYSRFLTFHGTFVLHCHILNHEDWGMMQKVAVKGNGIGPCVPVGLADGELEAKAEPAQSGGPEPAADEK